MEDDEQDDEDEDDEEQDNEEKVVEDSLMIPGGLGREDSVEVARTRMGMNTGAGQENEEGRERERENVLEQEDQAMKKNVMKKVKRKYKKMNSPSDISGTNSRICFQFSYKR